MNTDESLRIIKGISVYLCSNSMLLLRAQHYVMKIP